MKIKSILRLYCVDCETTQHFDFSSKETEGNITGFIYCCMNCSATIPFTREQLRVYHNRRKRNNFFSRKGIIHRTSLINRLRFRLRI